MFDKLVLALVVVGALNWGLVGLFQFDLIARIAGVYCIVIFQYDLVAALLGGQTSILSRIIYTLVALAGVWAISFFFRDTEACRQTARERHQ